MKKLFLLLAVLLCSCRSEPNPQPKLYGIKIICENHVAVMAVGTDKRCDGSIELRSGRWLVFCDDGRRYSTPRDCSTEYWLGEPAK